MQVIHRPEVSVVAAARFLGIQQREERVVEVVAPLRVHAIAERLARADHARIVEVALGDKIEILAQCCSEPFHLKRQLLHKVHRGKIDKRMHRIEAQAVAVIVLEPHRRIVTEESPHFIASRLIEIDRIAPGCPATFCEIWAEFGGVVSNRAEVVIDDVEDDADAFAVARVHKALEAVWATIGLVRCKEGNAIVSPAAMAGKLRDRHHVDVGDAEIGKIIEVLDRAVECSFLAEGSNVEFVEDCAGPGRGTPLLIVPPKPRVIIQTGWPVYALGLAPAARVRVWRGVVLDEECVVVADLCPRDVQGIPTACVRAVHGDRAITKLQLHLLYTWRPNAKAVHGCVSRTHTLCLIACEQRHGKLFQQAAHRCVPAFEAIVGESIGP